MHGDPGVTRRWAQLGLVAGGTGIAPLMQIVRIILDDPADCTHIRLLFINRYEDDILMRDDLEQLARKHPDRFIVNYSLTGKITSPTGWTGYTGRGSLAMIAEALPRPTNDGATMVLVCGTDGFVDTWGGAVSRGPKGPKGEKGKKIQGPLTGLLADAGFNASEVYKY